MVAGCAGFAVTGIRCGLVLDSGGAANIRTRRENNDITWCGFRQSVGAGCFRNLHNDNVLRWH